MSTVYTGLNVLMATEMPCSFKGANGQKSPSIRTTHFKPGKCHCPCHCWWCQEGLRLSNIFPQGFVLWLMMVCWASWVWRCLRHSALSDIPHRSLHNLDGWSSPELQQGSQVPIHMPQTKHPELAFSPETPNTRNTYSNQTICIIMNVLVESHLIRIIIIIIETSFETVFRSQQAF